MEDVKLLLTQNQTQAGREILFYSFPNISPTAGKTVTVSVCVCVSDRNFGILTSRVREYIIASAMCLNNMPASLQYSKWKTIHKMISESDVTYSQLWWPILGICALHLPIQVHTHSSGHKHTREHTHTAVGSHLCCGARGAVGGSCLAQGHLVVVLKVEERCTFTPPTDKSLPDRDSNSQPFHYESESLPLGHD